MLVFIGFPGAMVGTFSAGYLYDILGRKVTIFTAFILGSILTWSIPYTSPQVWPSLILVRSAIIICFAIPTPGALLADYCHKDAIGKASALVGLGFVIGEVLSMGVLFNATKTLDPFNAFLTVGITGAVFSASFLFLVKEPKLREGQSDAIRD